MAGQINLQPLIDQLFSAPPEAPAGVPSARPEDWQQSLLQSVDPQVQKKERIRNFLATFGNTLANTPGNFLQGVAAGAGKGATVYNQQRGEDTDKHTAAQKLIMEFQQSQQDRARGQVKDRYDVGRQVNADRQAEDDRIYTRGRQAKADELAAKRVEIADRRADNDAKRLAAKVQKNGGGGPLTEWQQTQTRTALENMVEKFQSSLGDPLGLSEEEAAANEDAVKAYRQKLYTLQNFDPETGDYLGGSAEEAPGIIPQAPNEQGKTSLPGKVLTAPPPANQRVVGQTYQSPNGPVIWMGTGWKKAQ